VKVLEGIRVLDFGRFIAGPFCAALLADFGADVIRIDRVGGSEDRFIMPVTDHGDGAFFLQANRNKRSIAVNLDSAEGKAVVEKLVRTADVVVANMPPRTIENLGLAYDTLRKLKRDIILTASSAFGLHPAVRERIGFDGVGQALSGAVHLTGFPDQPMKAMVPVVDFATAIACALGTVLALYERKSSGLGQEVTASLLQTGLNFASGTLIEEAILHLNRAATANRSPNYGPSDIFRVKDGWIIVQVLGPAMFSRWARLMGKPELVNDSRFGNDRQRGEHGELLSALMGEWCIQRTRADCLVALEQARIPAGPVYSPRETLEDELIGASGAFQWIHYPGVKQAVPIAVPPVSMTRTPPAITRRPPMAGEHTDEVLQELGYSGDAIMQMRTRGIL
jgi:crotonobetainyl-CoA:carnitine CoA-transferase CaiB-like acyl-CoA transferase